MSVQDMFAPKLTTDEVNEIWLWVNGREIELSPETEDKLYDLLDDQMPLDNTRMFPLNWMMDYLYRMGGTRLRHWLKANSNIGDSTVGESYPGSENEVSKKSKPIKYPYAYKNYRSLGTSKKMSLDKVTIKSTDKSGKTYGSRSVMQRSLEEGSVKMRDTISGRIQPVKHNTFSKNLVNSGESLMSTNLQVAVEMLNEEENKKSTRELEQAKRDAQALLLAWREAAKIHAKGLEDMKMKRKQETDGSSKKSNSKAMALKKKLLAATNKVASIKKKMAEKRVLETAEGQSIIKNIESLDRKLSKLQTTESTEQYEQAVCQRIKEGAAYRRLIKETMDQIDPPKIQYTRLEE